MCLAVPMKVVAVHGDPDDILSNQTAEVDADGVRREVRLDIVDTWPNVGDYLIIHAGFAIHSLEEEEALKNLALLREMAEKVVEGEEMEGRQ